MRDVNNRLHAARILEPSNYVTAPHLALGWAALLATGEQQGWIAHPAGQARCACCHGPVVVPAGALCARCAWPRVPVPAPPGQRLHTGPWAPRLLGEIADPVAMADPMEFRSLAKIS